MRSRRASAVFAAAVLLLATFSQGVLGAEPTPSSDRSVGEILAKGLRTAAGCQFNGPLEVTQTLSPAQAESKFIALSVTSDCRVWISAAWRGQLADGPPEIAKELSSLIAAQDPGGSVSAESFNSGPTRVASGGCKTSSQHAWMYGFGGSGDTLTSQDESISFCWDQVEAWLTSGNGSCHGSTPTPFWRWLVDSCTWPDFNWGPSSNGAGATLQGNYHCDPPGQQPCANGTGYYHQIFTKNTGYRNGGASCTYWFQGQGVQGSSHTVVNCTG
jgi:hypothetical protein